MSRKARYLFLLWIWGGTICGCRSTSSTFLSRMGNDQVAGNTNGKPGLHLDAKPFKGIPVTVSIPTHVDIAIQETLFFNEPDMKPVALSTRHLEAVPSFVQSDKIIAVDPKRPIAGSLDYSMSFGGAGTEYRDNQFFTKIGYDVKDETIKTIDNILKNVVPSLGLKDASATETAAKGIKKTKDATPDSGLMTIQRTIAWKRFDINDCNFESEVTAFVTTHLNSSQTPDGNSFSEGM